MRIYLIIIFCLPSVVFSQQSIDYHRIFSCGNIPKDFTQTSTATYEEDFSSNDDENLDKSFFLSTRFYIDQLLQSGKVIFNSPETNYIKNIAKYLLRDNKELFSELRFYILRSNSVNAFSMDQGIIVCTTGLIAHVENEAQLAFIIGHEISHYTEKHVRNGYIEYKDYEKEIGHYKRLSYYEAINQLSRYSKTQELDADKKGLDFYLNSVYDPAEIEQSFLNLNYSYLPFEEKTFDVGFLQTEHLTLPDYLFPDSIPEIKNNLDRDDSGSTHPNMKKRIIATNATLSNFENNGTQKFHILDEEEFKKIQKSARFESVNIDLSDRFYGDALFKIFLLKNEFPNERFLDISKVKAIYGLAKYKNYSRYSEVTFRIKFIEGESYKLHYFLKKINRPQLNILTYRHLYDMYQKYPLDDEFKAYFDDFHIEFCANSLIDFKALKSFSLIEGLKKQESPTLNFDFNDSIISIQLSDLPKIKKLRLKKSLLALKNELTQKDPLFNFHMYGLFDLVKSPDFTSKLYSTNVALKIQESKLKKEKKINDSKINKHGYRLGIDSVLIIDPIYEDYSFRGKKNEVKSELRKIKMSEMYSKSYKQLDIDITLLDSKSLDTESVREYNEISLTKDWMSEVLDHDGINMISSTRYQLNELTKHHKVSNYLFTGVYSYKTRKKITTLHKVMMKSIILIPLATIDLLMVYKNFEMVSIVINSKSDSVLMIDVQDVNLNASNKNMRSYIFNTLFQINSTK